MINSSPNHLHQRGAAALIITVMLMVAAALIIFYGTGHSILQQKASTNVYYNNQSYEAAEAGMEYALAYLQSNSATVTANPVNGFINYSPATTTLSNNATYAITYTNPTANNYDTLLITVVGTNAEGSSSRTLRQVATRVPPSLYTVTTKGNITVNGSGGNISGSYAVHSGGSTDPSAPSAGGQVIQNDTALATMSDDAFFQSIFGVTPAAEKAAATVYTNPNTVPWGSLSGTVWIDGDVGLQGTTSVGTPASPVLIIINGNFDSKGQSAVFNGLIYVRGTSADLKSQASINGALISEGDISFKGNAAVNYNAATVSALLGSNSGLSGFTKVPGGWRDF